MIKNEEVEIVGNGKTIRYYLNKGYKFKVGDKISIKMLDLIPTSTTKIDCYCDLCNSCNNIKYFNYIGNIERNGLYRCNDCSKSIRSNKIREIFLDEEVKINIVNKSRVTNIERYGETSAMKCDLIKNKSKSKNLEKYGVDNPMKSDLIKDRLKSSIMIKYGVSHFSKTDDFKIKYKTTCMEKYGCENTFQSEIVKSKIKETLMEKYGVDNPTKNAEIFERAQRHSYKIHKHDNIDISYQGTYELDFINYCILHNTIFEKGPVIDYILNSVNRKYHSDFYIPKYNLICEIKSCWTYERDLEENIKKKEFSEKSGYNFLFIIDKNYSNFNTF